MARTGNFFSVLSLYSDAEAESEERKVENSRNMPSSSKKKRRKSKKDVGTLLSHLSLGETTPQHSEPASLLDEELPPVSATTGNLIAAPDVSTDKDKSNNVGSFKWPLVWIDLEMTGLDLEKDRILEIACIITDGRLKRKVEGPDLIIYQSEEQLASMGEWCQAQHTASGLVEDVRRSKLTEKEAEEEVLKFVRNHTENGTKQPLLAGNSVYVDLLFLRKYMPDLAALFPHVVVDVSSIKALCLRWFPEDAKQAPTKKKNHRALADIRESIEELQYMQKAIFKNAKK